MSSRALRVCAIQMVCENGQRQANLQRAQLLVQQAADAGAKLVALPELFSGGYRLSEQAWDTAEPQDGPTEEWLRETAHRHGIYLGGSYLQATAMTSSTSSPSPHQPVRSPAGFPSKLLPSNRTLPSRQRVAQRSGA